MSVSGVVGEGDVLVTTVRYLFRSGYTPTQISVPRGRGIPTRSIEDCVKRTFEKESNKSVKPEFKGSGPDIVAESNGLYWIVECKGWGTGKPATQRNNFDRALASVVSYYDLPVAKGARDGGKAILGLALPATEQYLKLLNDRVRAPLRKRLKLWVLLYRGSKTRSWIEAIEPNDAYPPL